MSLGAQIRSAVRLPQLCSLFTLALSWSLKTTAMFHDTQQHTLFVFALIFVSAGCYFGSISGEFVISEYDSMVSMLVNSCQLLAEADTYATIDEV